MRDGKPVLVNCPTSTSSTTRKANRRHPEHIGRRPLRPSAIPMATCKCCNGPSPGAAPRFALIVHHTDADANRVPPHLARRQLDKAWVEALREGVDNRGYEARLEPDIPARSGDQAPSSHENTCTSHPIDLLHSHLHASLRVSLGKTPNPPVGQKTQHPRHLGRRHRHHQYQRLQRRPDGLHDAQHRSHRQRGPALPPLLRRAKLHRRPRGVPDRPTRHPHGTDQSRLPRRPDGHEPARSVDRRAAQEPRLRHRASSARTTSATATRRLPTVNGFDEFFGNLYHLNAEEEPELPDYPKDPAYRAKFGPRGVLKCKATDKDDPTEDPRFGKVGKQTIEDTGPLTKKRMETIDDETSAAAIDYMKRQQAPASRSSAGGTARACTCAPT